MFWLSEAKHAGQTIKVTSYIPASVLLWCTVKLSTHNIIYRAGTTDILLFTRIQQREYQRDLHIALELSRTERILNSNAARWLSSGSISV